MPSLLRSTSVILVGAVLGWFVLSEPLMNWIPEGSA